MGSISPYGHITITYRAEFYVPEDVFRKFGHTEEYKQFSYRASSKCAASGQDSYSEVIEWVEDPVQRNCEDFIGMWHNKILLWKEQL